MKTIYNLFFISLILFSARVTGQGTSHNPDTTLSMSKELTEIVIKASKDNVTHKTIPASVSVITADNIKETEIRRLNEITATAPNFFMPDYGSKLTSPVYIRGIGSRINSPSVGLYVDHVPYFEKASFDFDFFDVTRIEVLRGPQGTLFGRNTMGGIVNVNTTSPLDYQGNHINITGGNYGFYSLNAGHYGRSDKLAYSVAANVRHNDGFYRNEYTGKNVDNLNSYGLRNRLIYEASDRFTVENIAGFELSRQGGYPYAIYNDTLNRVENINYNQFSSYDRDLFSDAMLMKYAGQGFELISTTSYQFLNDRQKIDQDFTTDSLFFIIQDQKQQMLSQELIARSSGSRKYKWLLGGYAFYQLFNNAVNVDAWAQHMNYLKKYDHRIRGAALFHQSSLTDFPLKNLTLTAGLRVDYEMDELDYYYDRTLRGKYALIDDTLYRPLRSLELMPRFALNYSLRNHNLYVVVARGYKTGGFNSTFERPEDLTFEPEYSWNYETGIKSSFLDNSLNADLSFFYIDWKNQQIYQTVPSGRGSMLKNAGHSVSKGVELTIAATLPKGFDLMLSYGYTDARFQTYELNDSTNYNGNYIPYVPAHTAALQAAKTFTMPGSHLVDRIRLSSLLRSTGRIYWNEENMHSENGYYILDAKLSFIRKSLQLDIWAKNLLNANYLSFYFEALGNRYAQSGKPAQVGMNLSIKF